MTTLLDLCHDYIQSAHDQSGEMTANQKIYNYCVEYIYSNIMSCAIILPRKVTFPFE